MAKNVISNIWGQNATNRQIFSEDEVALGIEYKGPVVSPQLNGIAFDLYTYVDNLQRANAAWNPLKNYAVGDTVNVRVLYNNNQLDMNFACISPGQSQPLATQAFATAFTVDSSNQVAVFTITDDGTHKITEYVSTNWVYLQNAGAYEAEKFAVAKIAELEKKLNEEIERAKAEEQRIIGMIKVLQDTPSQSAIPIHSIATAVQAGTTVTYPAGTLLEFTASKDLTNGGDCYIFFITLATSVMFNNLNVELFQIGDGGVTSGKKYYLKDFLQSNHAEGFDYPLDLTLLPGFGGNASFFYGLGQYLSSNDKR